MKKKIILFCITFLYILAFTVFIYDFISTFPYSLTYRGETIIWFISFINLILIIYPIKYKTSVKILFYACIFFFILFNTLNFLQFQNILDFPRYLILLFMGLYVLALTLLSIIGLTTKNNRLEEK